MGFTAAGLIHRQRLHKVQQCIPENPGLNCTMEHFCDYTIAFREHDTRMKSNSYLDSKSETFPWKRHVITWHHPSSCLSSWDDQHTALVLWQELCAGQHHKASEPQIVALWRWIPSSPSRDSTLLAVNHTARNEVKWHYLHNMGASSIFINGADSLYSLERGGAILGNGYK